MAQILTDVTDGLDNWHRLDYHDLCTIFPPMTDHEYDSLVASMKNTGYLRSDPIILVEQVDEKGKNPELVILDGRNRHLAAMDASVAPNFMLYVGEDPVGFVTSRNMDRRHLTTGQKASIASKLAKKRVGDNQFSGEMSRKKAAKQMDTTETAVKRFRIVEKADPALAAAVDSGTMTLNAAYQQVKGEAEVAEQRPEETTVPEKPGASDPKPPEQSAKGNRPDPNEKMGSTNMDFDGTKEPVYSVWYDNESGKVVFEFGEHRHEMRPDTAEALFGDLETVLGAIGEEAA